MGDRKFEGRKERGIEGMSWGKDTTGGIICSSSVGKLGLACPYPWSQSSRFLFISSSGLCLELTISLSLCFCSISGDKEPNKEREEENKKGSSAPLHLTCMKTYVGGTVRLSIVVRTREDK